MSQTNELPQPPAHPLDQNWYVYSDGAPKGPLSGHEVRNLIQAGELSATAGVAKVGDDAWQEIRQHVFFGQFSPIKAPNAPPPASPHHPVTTRVAPVTEDQQAYAGFWIRVCAYLIDSVLVTAACYLAGLILGIVLAVTDISGSGVPVLVVVVGLAISIGYWVAFTSGSWQATPGKRLLGLKVIRADGRQVTAGLALGRSLAYVLSALTLYIGFIMVGLTAQKRGLHDMICGTRVVYGKN
ncbi:RDD family protein [Bosea sp. RAC05]|uniref:RDD family protein n=1 Tax=Bosea sp. RAC05 TaxID=1842539 RepID=UPI0008580F61|nr:RDD family protein [Bosea sp. RAC05]AOG02811.1 RDD family protein [Bosea sp. RAC05]